MPRSTLLTRFVGTGSSSQVAFDVSLIMLISSSEAIGEKLVNFTPENRLIARSGSSKSVVVTGSVVFRIGVFSSLFLISKIFFMKKSLKVLQSSCKLLCSGSVGLFLTFCRCDIILNKPPMGENKGECEGREE